MPTYVLPYYPLCAGKLCAVRSQANLKEKQTESEERKAKVDADQL